MKNIQKIESFGRIRVFLFLIIVFIGSHPVQAIELGITYDQKSYQEIEDLLIPPVLNWVKKGEFILQTGNLDFEWQRDDEYLKMSIKNEGRYGIDEKGVLIEIETQKPPEYIYGYPFPRIDSKDPIAAEKIMENNAAMRYRAGSIVKTDRIPFVEKGGQEKTHVSTTHSLFYQNRERGPIRNPENFLSKRLVHIEEPFDIRGMVYLTWVYNDAREDSSWVYDT